MADVPAGLESVAHLTAHIPPWGSKTPGVSETASLPEGLESVDHLTAHIPMGVADTRGI